MVCIERDFTKAKKKLSIVSTEYDIGFNAGLGTAIAILGEYADGLKCPVCGSTNIYSFKCMDCAFDWGN